MVVLESDGAGVYVAKIPNILFYLGSIGRVEGGWLCTGRPPGLV